MATEVTLPRLSPGMNEASVARWLKKAGEPVKQGEALFEVETEKVATEVPAPVDGVLHVVVPEGKTVAIGTVLALLAAPGETVASAPAAGAAPAAPAPPVAASPGSGEVTTARRSASESVGAPSDVADEGRVVASPAARRLSRELGVSLEGLKGSGPGGRIIEKDVQRRAAQAPVPTPAGQPAAAPAAAPAIIAAQTRPLQGIRKIIADRMLQSQNTNATVTVTLEVDMHEAVNLRTQLVGEWEQREGVRVTYTDIIVKAVAKALTEHRRLNASLQGDRIVEHGEVHVGVAVALDDGLIVPVVRDADRKSLLEVAREAKELGGRAHQGRLGVGEVTGGTFTVTNLGASGVDAFTPIINPPECAILGVGKIAEKPVARGGQVVIRPTMWLSLTFDHRIVDGKPAADFLKRVQEILEKPYLVFV
jgi:pyruvate dehydrogenase E2 component (dihydrolipoamide acetyltransferase)